jgi:hypothetical protein
LGRELTVVGFDDIAMAAWDVFRLTTVRCDLGAMAETAVGLLMQRIKDPELPYERVVLTPGSGAACHRWAADVITSAAFLRDRRVWVAGPCVMTMISAANTNVLAIAKRAATLIPQGNR